MFAQEALIKHLQQQLSQHTQADTFRVNRLNELGQVPLLPVGRIDTLSREALAISRKINYAVGEGYALVNQSLVKSRNGDKAGAFTIIQQALNIAQKTGDQPLLANVYIGIGKSKFQTSENKQALAYYLMAEAVAQQTPDKKLLSTCQRIISSIYQTSLSDYSKAMEWNLKSAKTAEDANCLDCLALAWTSEANIYSILGDQASALVYYKKALEANKQLGNKILQNNLSNNIGERYRIMGNYPEAIKAYKDGLKDSDDPYYRELNESNLADVYVRLSDLPLALRYGFHSLAIAKKINDMEGVAWIDGVLARAYLKLNKADSAIYFGKLGFDAAKQTSTKEYMRDNCGALADAYARTKDFANAYKFQNLFFAYRDSMINTQVTNHSLVMQYNYDLQKKQAQITALNQEKKIQYLFLAGATIVLTLIGLTVVILYRSNRQKQKANNLLAHQKELIEEQRDQTEKTLRELKITQAQLIQSEKMASLGELTAGIAHEIQNPLNFVNNFSGVSTELIDELNEELDNGDIEEAKTIAADIKQNLEKINHHGKRADSIVKGMLEHSRATTGAKEPTDVNKLAREYLQLAYHGLRAKDKTFNAELITRFQENMPLVNIIPHDIGRVLLNLLNNAFYAVQQKAKAVLSDYKPAVELTTAQQQGMVIISVKDNGNGIPAAIQDKIMQPFFTTKPTGEGTGLGLSLSYDIVVKAHGGNINVDSGEGKGSTFNIILPAQ